MQRIDENIYIDDSLVTCAEYQLFIDEMCEQGKYYQPDHWTSYQFPVGQAREPILGIRFNDIEAFCDWLRRREDGEWFYRQPNYLEAAKYPIKSTNNLSIGYWIKGGNYQFGFAWIGDPIRDRFLAQPLDLNHAYSLAGFLARVLEDALNREHNDVYSLSRNRIMNLAHALSRDLSFSSYKALDRSLADALEVAGTLTKRPTLDVNLYTDLFTLDTRIAGLSAACEGIRLVKERIR